MDQIKIDTQKLKETVVREKLLFYPVSIYLIGRILKAPYAAFVIGDEDCHIISYAEIPESFGVFFETYVSTCYNVLSGRADNENIASENAVFVSFLSDEQLYIKEHFKIAFYLGQIDSAKNMVIRIQNPPAGFHAADFQEKLQLLCDSFKP